MRVAELFASWEADLKGQATSCTKVMNHPWIAGKFGKCAPCQSSIDFLPR